MASLALRTEWHSFLSTFSRTLESHCLGPWTQLAFHHLEIKLGVLYLKKSLGNHLVPPSTKENRWLLFFFSVTATLSWVSALFSQQKLHSASSNQEASSLHPNRINQTQGPHWSHSNCHVQNWNLPWHEHLSFLTHLKLLLFYELEQCYHFFGGCLNPRR